MGHQHIFYLSARQYLKATFQNRVISRGCTIPMPSGSLDITPMDCFVWGFLKDAVYSPKPQNNNELEQFIREEFESLNENVNQCSYVVESVYGRLWKCLIAEGKHFKSLNFDCYFLFFLFEISI